jgi:serine/threonine-protein kinase
MAILASAECGLPIDSGGGPGHGLLLRDGPGARASRPPSILDNGRYVLHEPVGQGSTCVVWSAWDSRYRRLVALKVPLPHIQRDEQLLSQILSEAAACAALASDHLIRVQHVGRCPATGLAYLDLELCAEFSDNRRRLARSAAKTAPRDVSEAVRWVMQAARGMAVAHAHRIYHPGLGLGSILIRPETRRAQVSDLGVAPRGSAPDAGEVGLMAPEELERPTLLCTARSPADSHQRRVRIDVYRLGAILYQLVSGAPPYAVRDGAGEPAADVLAQQRKGPPPRVRNAGRRHGSRLRAPARLERIVCKALERAPSDRYASCADFADDLGRFLGKEASSLDAERLPLRLSLWSARRWRLLSAVLSLVLSLLGVGSYQWAKRKAEQTQREIALSRVELKAKQKQLQQLQVELRAPR